MASFPSHTRDTLEGDISDPELSGMLGKIVAFVDANRAALTGSILGKKWPRITHGADTRIFASKIY